MVASNFDGLVDYKILHDAYEGQGPLKAHDCVFGLEFSRLPFVFAT